LQISSKFELGEPSIAATTLLVTIQANLSGSYSLAGLKLGGSISVALDADCPNITSLAIIDSAQVTIRYERLSYLFLLLIFFVD
jgi:hypothetical protein